MKILAMGEVVSVKKTVIVIFILLLGFVLRSFSMDFPSIGYHNMKENEYLSMAQEMIRTKDFVNRRIYFYNAFEKNPVMKLYPQPPLVSYQILLSWKLLGDNLWGPRLFNVLFGIAGIVVMYLIARLLFQETRYVLFCAFLLALMPLGVFFSRNLQPESPAFFFMLLAHFFYLKFVTGLKKYNLFLGGVLFSIAWLYKFSFLFGLLPFIFCLPVKALWNKKREILKYIAVFFISYLPIIIAIVWLRHVGQWEFDARENLNRIRLFEVFSFSYWNRYGHAIWQYIYAENYTLLFSLLALTGIIIALRKRKGLLNRYIIGWAFTIIPYSMVFSDFINQHSYYQMPFLGLVCIASVYATIYIFEHIKRLSKNYVFFIILITLVSIPSIFLSITRMYRCVFLGEDVAGESLREFTSSDEHIFILTHCQGYGVARYAQRYAGWPATLEEFKEKEERFKMRYICIYPAEYSEGLKVNRPLYDYILNNYHLKEVGLIKNMSAYNAVYTIYEKGKAGPDIDNLLHSYRDKIALRKVYTLLGRHFDFYTLRL